MSRFDPSPLGRDYKGSVGCEHQEELGPARYLQSVWIGTLMARERPSATDHHAAEART